MSTAVLLLGCTLLLLPSWQRFGFLHPLTVTLALWASVGLLFALRPFNIELPSLRVSIAIVLGLTALAVPTLLLDHRAGGQDALQPRPVRMTVRVWPLAGAALTLTAAVVWATLQYRAQVSAVVGVPFGQVDTRLVRWAELYGGLTLSGPVGIAQSLTPLIGVLGIVGGLYHRWWWYGLVAVALGGTMQSPSRTATITVAVACVFFFVLLSRSRNAALGRRTTSSRARLGTITLLGVVGALGLIYFGSVSADLQKSAVPPGLEVAEWVPGPAVQPLLYQVGGVSAFTAALEDAPDASPYGEFGRSVYGLVKVVHLAGVHVQLPDPFATYVDMPIPFNTYTAFGDAYFDFGLAGVIGVFLFNGVVLHVVSRWPSPGHPVSVWAMSLMAAVLTATPIHMRLLDIDVLAPGVVGSLLLLVVLRPARSPAVTCARRPLAGVAGPRPTREPVAG